MTHTTPPKSMFSSIPPERIYGWMQSQLSIARFYGGCTYQGHTYNIDMADPAHPLVRQDVLMREAKEHKRKQAQAECEAKRSQKSLL